MTPNELIDCWHSGEETKVLNFILGYKFVIDAAQLSLVFGEDFVDKLRAAAVERESLKHEAIMAINRDIKTAEEILQEFSNKYGESDPDTASLYTQLGFQALKNTLIKKGA